MLEQLWSWVPWVTGIGVVGAAVGLALLGGLSPFLRLLADILTPIGKQLGEIIAQGLRVAWEWVVKPGFRNLFQAWQTVVVVAAMMWGISLYHSANQTIQANHQARVLNQCQVDLKRFKKLGPITPAPQLWEFKWPF